MLMATQIKGGSADRAQLSFRALEYAESNHASRITTEPLEEHLASIRIFWDSTLYQNVSWIGSGELAYDESGHPMALPSRMLAFRLGSPQDVRGTTIPTLLSPARYGRAHRRWRV